MADPPSRRADRTGPSVLGNELIGTMEAFGRPVNKIALCIPVILAHPAAHRLLRCVPPPPVCEGAYSQGPGGSDEGGRNRH
jgi:hypothetical protein